MTTELTRKQFDILEALATADKTFSQRDLEKHTGYSLGTVNKAIKELTDLGYIEKSKITDKGIEALEPYRAKRAVFIAAGFGSRMVPITLNTPKPLVRVNGKRIIDTLIDACLAAGIEEIYIARGYLAEQFDQLLLKYPMIREDFVETPDGKNRNTENRGKSGYRRASWDEALSLVAREIKRLLRTYGKETITACILYLVISL